MQLTTRRRSDPVLVFAVLTVVTAGAAIAAWLMHRNNAARVAAYHQDAACGTQLTPNDAAAAAAHPLKSCAIERATVRARWVHTNKSTHYYRAAFTLPDDSVDSLELKGKRPGADWAVMPIGTTVTVERFSDPDPGAKRQVTAVRAAGAPTPSAWNPLLRERDTNIGMVAMGILATAFGIGWNWAIGRRRATQEL